MKDSTKTELIKQNLLNKTRSLRAARRDHAHPAGQKSGSGTVSHESTRWSVYRTEVNDYGPAKAAKILLTLYNTLFVLIILI